MSCDRFRDRGRVLGDLAGYVVGRVRCRALQDTLTRVLASSQACPRGRVALSLVHECVLSFPNRDAVKPIGLEESLINVRF